MAAGLAHELNNPAAAARRAAAHLRETTDKVQSLLCQLTRTLEHDHLRHLVTASQDALERSGKAPALDHLERSDRADAIAIWLETHGAATAWELAPTFVNAGVDTVWLDEFAGKLPAASHADALGWLEAVSYTHLQKLVWCDLVLASGKRTAAQITSGRLAKEASAASS